MWLALSPGTFFDVIAGYEPRNDHFLRDDGAFYTAFGVALLASVSRPSWRLPLLVLGTVQGVVHTISHVIDVSDTDPSYQGPLNLIVVAALTILLAWMAREAARHARAGQPPPG